MTAKNKVPGTDVHGSAGAAPTKGPTAVSELVADRAAAPSPFGDDLTFPLPVDRLTYTPSKPA